MKKHWIISLMLLSFLLVLSACGNQPEAGMNKISLKELEEKLDNEETFLLVTFSAGEEDVEKSELVEVFDDSLNRVEKTAFYVNFDGESQETLDQLGEKYTPSEYKGDVWEPKDDGLVLISDGGVMKNPRQTLLSQSLIEGTANGTDGYETSFFEYMDDIDGGISDILEYIQQNNIELTY
ncbi:hypothetical protein [Oceanobacillus sp. CF4.6]|uniref:hypothetical protein n=1 Tax=Oceanobacillus sp. CF4.6 TaxID=3373080 RepID=UPI003EE76792